ncbi:hypothetical protein BJ508DRAFT_330766 [Ascobolus immersus RN42]|uniref:Uncharacterized protein n=1 Tax=Ascobolus immersus RN42 TaxID=1160509 RepID=A0A3N4HSG6_ASCIM|nr:hypothetical protein BJ508DRAFT_330766 [Ascobolus immersus RN42]
MTVGVNLKMYLEAGRKMVDEINTLIQSSMSHFEEISKIIKSNETLMTIYGDEKERERNLYSVWYCWRNHCILSDFQGLAPPLSIFCLENSVEFADLKGRLTKLSQLYSELDSELILQKSGAYNFATIVAMGKDGTPCEFQQRLTALELIAADFHYWGLQRFSMVYIDQFFYSWINQQAEKHYKETREKSERAMELQIRFRQRLEAAVTSGTFWSRSSRTSTLVGSGVLEPHSWKVATGLVELLLDAAELHRRKRIYEAEVLGPLDTQAERVMFPCLFPKCQSGFDRYLHHIFVWPDHCYQHIQHCEGHEQWDRHRLVTEVVKAIHQAWKPDGVGPDLLVDQVWLCCFCGNDISSEVRLPTEEKASEDLLSEYRDHFRIFFAHASEIDRELVENAAQEVDKTIA